MPGKGRIWVIDDDRSIRWVLEKALQQGDMEVRCFESAAGIVERLQAERPDVVITDIRMPGPSGLELLDAIKKEAPDLPVIITTAYTDLESAVASYRGGAFEYLPKPFDVDEAVKLAQRAVEHGRRSVEAPTAATERVPEIIGEAPSMQEVFRAIGRLSRSHMSVLINGESGTGKELVARALHNHGPRADKPFIAINISAIPGELLESELFGHERGAFTGAHTQRRGRFEQANGGTLFLDEIGDMPAELQTRLLRVLSEGKFFRVGGHEQLDTDVRIIVATHHNLEQRVQEGGFRDDLFHRLNVIRIHLPPLRERRGDITALAQEFLKRSALELGVEPKRLAPEALKYLCSLDWPGNVRQLENTCRWLTVMAPGQTIRIDDLPNELRPAQLTPATTAEWETALEKVAEQRLSQGESAIINQLGAQFERVMIQAALRHTGGHKQEAARCLGWGRNTLTRKLKELGIET